MSHSIYALVGMLLLQGVRALAVDPVDEPLLRGSKFLLAQQDAKTGAITSDNRRQTVMTSLSILALAALGHQPGDPTPEGKAMKVGLDYVLRAEAQQVDGYFGVKDGGGMYGHGITTLMLAEMLGMGATAEQDVLIREKCGKAIRLIERAQKVTKSERNKGGWRYRPDDTNSDLSATVWQVMALRAAKNAGMDVSNEAIADAVKYIKGLYEDVPAKAGETKRGGFGYENKGHGISTTAEGLLALQVCGEYEAPEVLKASEQLLKVGAKDDNWFFYTQYYYAQGMYQRGGKHAVEARRIVAESLLPIQAGNGSWEKGGGDAREGKVYTTSLAILSLAVKDHFLPIYQR